jgi:hypothetical protein
VLGSLRGILGHALRKWRHCNGWKLVLTN